MIIDDDDSYEFMQLTHMTAICFGLPYSRRPINEGDDCKADSNVAGGHRYAFDWRLIPVWTFYACLNVYVLRYNYAEGVRYVGTSFRACFEESYCFALIELFNRNVGPSSNVACSMFYGRGHKTAALAGTERALRFLRETRDAAPRRSASLCRFVRYYAVVSVCLYLVFTQLYAAMVPAVVVALYWANGMGQVLVYMLVFTHYYVLERSFARVNDLIEAVDTRHDLPAACRALVRLTDAYDELCELVDRVNRAYAPDMLLQWLYNIVRVIMIVFRLLEIVSALDGPLAPGTPFLIVEHVGELFIFVVHTSCTCNVGERLSKESKRILASLQKLKLRNEFDTDVEMKKAICVFSTRANSRNVNASIGGYIIFNMGLIQSVCSVLATYILVLIQFRDQKGKSKPLYYNWN